MLRLLVLYAVMFALSLAEVRKGFMVSFNGTSNDVVQDGEVQAEWSELDPMVLPSLPYDIGFDVTLMPDDGYPVSQDYEVTFVQQILPSKFNMIGQPAEMTSTISITGKKPIHLDFNCKSEGEGLGYMQIEFTHPLGPSPYETIKIYFKYTCVKPLFDVGSSWDFADAVLQDKVQSQWNFISQDDEKAVEFYLWIDGLSPELNWPYVPQLKYKRGIFMAEMKSFDTTAHQNGLVKPDNPSFMIEFNCESSLTATTTADVSVDIYYGWEEPLTIPFKRTCNATAGQEGMSGLEIFCLVVFLLSMTFCLAGCGFNHCVRGKQGMDAVPGIDFVRSFVGNVHDPKTKTPQADYDQPLQGATGGGGYSYQSDL